MEFGRTIAHSLFMIFMDLRKWMRSSEIFSNFMTIKEKMELGLHKDNFTELLAEQHTKLMSEDLVEPEAQRKDRERQQGK